jgi:hypothetical protein
VATRRRRQRAVTDRSEEDRLAAFASLGAKHLWVVAATVAQHTLKETQ